MEGFELAGENAGLLLVHTRVELGEGLVIGFAGVLAFKLRNFSGE